MVAGSTRADAQMPTRDRKAPHPSSSILEAFYSGVWVSNTSKGSKKAMNKHLDKAIFNIGKVDALMYSIEQLYLDFEVMPEEQEKLNRGAYAFSVSYTHLTLPTKRIV